MAKKVTVIFVVVAACLAIAAGFSTWRGGEIQASNCKGVNELRVVLTQILTRSRDVAQESPEYSPAEKQLAENFYNEALEELEPTKC